MDPSQSFGTIAADFVARNISKIVEVSSSVLTGAKSETQLRLRTAYTNYLSRTAERYGKAKSFFVRSTPTSIYDFYVPLGVTARGRRISKVSLASVQDTATRVIVTAGAGAGKSMLLRHLLLNSIQESDLVPVLIELRTVGADSTSLIDAIAARLEDFGFTLGADYVKKALKLGHFVILLDGYDEIIPASRKSIADQILRLAQSSPNCMLIVSSRPDDTFSGWEDFEELSISPLRLSEACELVEKLPFDQDIKDKFIADLKESLFEKHESFLSNPLLLSIMLLTYGQSAEIPAKLSIFYNQAYEALFQRHDALKGGYQRERLTDLDIQDFAKIFATFCLQTYDSRAFQFSRSDALGYLRKAKKYVSVEVSEEEFLGDCLQSVCLLVEDGLNIVFSHRSFQEYFVAAYIAGADPRVQRELLDRFLDYLRYDSVYTLLLEIDRSLVEREVLAPKLEQIFSVDLKVKRKVGITHFFRFIKQNFEELAFRLEDGKPHFSLLHLQPLGRPRRPKVTRAIEIVAFTYNHYVAPEISLPPGGLEEFIGRYAREDDVRFKTAALTIRSPVVRDLAVTPGLFSIAGLERVRQVGRNLASKHASVPKTLEELLG